MIVIKFSKQVTEIRLNSPPAIQSITHSVCCIYLWCVLDKYISFTFHFTSYFCFGRFRYEVFQLFKSHNFLLPSSVTSFLTLNIVWYRCHSKLFFVLFCFVFFLSMYLIKMSLGLYPSANSRMLVRSMSLVFFFFVFGNFLMLK